MASSIVRQWHILTLLPRAPRRIDAAGLEAQLRALGFRAHRRTIQRDLVELASVFPIEVDERTKPFGWRWADGAVLPFAGTCPGDAEGTAVSVRLRVRASAARAVAAVLAPEDARPLARAASPVGGDVELVLVLRDGPSLVRKLLALADDVHVLAPAPLRAELARVHARAAARHDDAGRSRHDELTSAR